MAETANPIWAENAIKNFFDVWINPEIERRIADGRLAKGFPFIGAQIIFHMDGTSPTVRINDEVEAYIKAKPVDGEFEVGKPVMSNEVEEIHEVSLTDKDPNAGHVTILNLNGKIHCAFNFRYNAALVRETLAAVDEFVESAATALGRGHMRPFVENLWSAMELLAKSYLMWSDANVLRSRSHGYIHSRFNMQAKLGNVEGRWADLLNRMTKLRDPARYLSGPLPLAEKSAREMLCDAKDLLAFVRMNNPPRHSDERVSKTIVPANPTQTNSLPSQESVPADPLAAKRG